MFAGDAGLCNKLVDLGPLQLRSLASCKEKLHVGKCVDVLSNLILDDHHLREVDVPKRADRHYEVVNQKVVCKRSCLNERPAILDQKVERKPNKNAVVEYLDCFEDSLNFGSLHSVDIVFPSLFYFILSVNLRKEPENVLAQQQNKHQFLCTPVFIKALSILKEIENKQSRNLHRVDEFAVVHDISGRNQVKLSYFLQSYLVQISPSKITHKILVDPLRRVLGRNQKLFI